MNNFVLFLLIALGISMLGGAVNYAVISYEDHQFAACVKLCGPANVQSVGGYSDCACRSNCCPAQYLVPYTPVCK